MRSSMSETREYYERLINIIKNDVELLLEEDDPKARPPKSIKTQIDLMRDCETKIAEIDTDAPLDLSPEARAAIDDIIKKDLERHG